MFNLIVAYFNLLGLTQELDYMAMCALDKGEQVMYERRAGRAIDLITRIRKKIRRKFVDKMVDVQYGDERWATLCQAALHYDLCGGGCHCM